MISPIASSELKAQNLSTFWNKCDETFKKHWKSIRKPNAKLMFSLWLIGNVAVVVELEAGVESFVETALAPSVTSEK